MSSLLQRICLSTFVGLVAMPLALAADLPVISDVEVQPFRAQAKRLVQALQVVGSPLSADQQAQLDAALEADEEKDVIAGVQRVLDPLCLAAVTISPESRVMVMPGPAEKELARHGWRVFLVKVHNQAGVTAPLRVQSPNAAQLVRRSSGSPDPKNLLSPQDVVDRWLEIDTFVGRPMSRTLSGFPLEYRLVELYSRDAGQREAKISFDVGQGTQDLGFRNEVDILFECLPSVDVQLEVRDDDGTETTGQFIFRDARERVYPARSRRLEPDFFFHDQIYRHSGESIRLPPGEYDVTYTRGPEYVVEHRKVEVPDADTHREVFELTRWIEAADFGWISGDHHIHAAGCAHYESPTEGVTPEAMMRHILGEDLNVGCVLAWGPCWYHQKEYFEGKTHALSQPKYLMRYDVEVSGFPSSHAGHLTLLRLVEDDYPETKKIEDWPSWDLPVLQWAKGQGGVVGFAHSGWGLKLPDDQLPNYAMPPFDGIGANEFIVDVTHDAVDFISTVDTPSVWELNIWYHTLNCGYTCRISGETDFPCIYGERVGLGRSYVQMPPRKEGTAIDYDAWAQGVRDGRSYVSDGLSHLMNYQINGLAVGTPGADDRISVLQADGGEALEILVDVAAYLNEIPQEHIRRRPLDQKPYWHVERARIEDSRKVPVELIVNGEAVARQEIEADGSVEQVRFDYSLDKSSWVAVRIFPSSHTNPIFVEVDGKPIRASRRSAQWCRDAVDVCWGQKVSRIRESEREAAEAAYDHARQAYEQIIQESP